MTIKIKQNIILRVRSDHQSLKKYNLKTKKENFRNFEKWFPNMKYFNESEKMLKTYTFQYSNMFV